MCCNFSPEYNIESLRLSQFFDLADTIFPLISAESH